MLDTDRHHHPAAERSNRTLANRLYLVDIPAYRRINSGSFADIQRDNRIIFVCKLGCEC